MAGIYFHVPFCKQACHYCDFHFSTNLKPMEAMVWAMDHELRLRKDFLGTKQIETIYFGGGTPSMIPATLLQQLLDRVHELFEVSADVEITLEANPDDINKEILAAWRTSGVNRLSIGIQTFDDDRLKFLNRAHDSREAIRSVELAKQHGFGNLTCDLIYAIPPNSMEKWERDLDIMLELDIPHLSLYGLTVESETVFGKWKSAGKLKEVTESANADQYAHAINTLSQAGYEHYEVSNFCLPGRYSRHNSAYWLQKPYLGIGPGAHSYDGHTRSFAIRNNTSYIRSLEKKELPLEAEDLSPTQQANEYMLTRIRTGFGINPKEISTLAGVDFLEKFGSQLKSWINTGLMEAQGDIFRLTSLGMMNADEITLKLFLDEP
ncbi:MAG: radical SAM family heme chaperone HemW [Cytophagales bacterium]|nr:radical SAM family heme chaperone HemW [Cytophagales bacterium]